MSKFEFIDLTKSDPSEEKKKNVLALASGLIQAAANTAYMLKLSYKDVALALHTAANVVAVVGKKAGKLSDDDIDNIKEASSQYSKEKEKELEESGIMNIIQAIRDVGKKGEGDE